ncbi:MAG: TIGR00730 family Rossman fold protein [Pseudomonadales bacterium]|nr:TIGR00730 family Rossman fold protein [Pseudomonadales bacterium]
MSDEKASQKTSTLDEEHFDVPGSLPDTEQTRSQSFLPAYDDSSFLLREELRPVRFRLELLKPELLQQEQGINSTVVVFGSTRIPEPTEAKRDLSAAVAAAEADPEDSLLKKAAEIAGKIEQKSRYYEQARELGQLITEQSQSDNGFNAVIVTGSGNGIMEAANRGAHDAGGKSIGLNIILPREQYPNAYVTPELCFQFQYFALRKMHFLLRARALVVFPGGYGTLDELFETLTLIQTRKMKPLPVLLFGEEYWRRIINFEVLVEEGTIDQEEFELFQFVESPQQAWGIIKQFYAG